MVVVDEDGGGHTLESSVREPSLTTSSYNIHHVHIIDSCKLRGSHLVFPLWYVYMGRTYHSRAMINVYLCPTPPSSTTPTPTSRPFFCLCSIQPLQSRTVVKELAIGSWQLLRKEKGKKYILMFDPDSHWHAVEQEFLVRKAAKLQSRNKEERRGEVCVSRCDRNVFSVFFISIYYLSFSLKEYACLFHCGHPIMWEREREEGREWEVK
ncbi:MAG: hypothetical protein J3R72DRAFT_7503 [Linnemannia gamsii]|nr:MAG: hypothetical protein J3R72DRAFT_7503 [Linnemannia gamsii]